MIEEAGYVEWGGCCTRDRGDDDDALGVCGTQYKRSHTGRGRDSGQRR